jgi:hypothetical protein
MRCLLGPAHTIVLTVIVAVGLVQPDLGASAQVSAPVATPPLIEEVSQLVTQHFYDREAVERVG